jgi:hypothetical protein
VGWIGGTILLAFGAGTLYLAATSPEIVGCGALQVLFGFDGFLSLIGALVAFGEKNSAADEIGPGEIIGIISGIAFAVGLVGLFSTGCGTAFAP